MSLGLEGLESRIYPILGYFWGPPGIDLGVANDVSETGNMLRLLGRTLVVVPLGLGGPVNELLGGYRATKGFAKAILVCPS